MFVSFYPTTSWPKSPGWNKVNNGLHAGSKTSGHALELAQEAHVAFQQHA